MALKGGSQGKWDRRQEVWTLLSLPLLVYSLPISWLKEPAWIVSIGLANSTIVYFLIRPAE